MIADELTMVKPGFSLEQRLNFLRLSLEERRRQMEEQAELMLRHGESERQLVERLEWQGGDIVES